MSGGRTQAAPGFPARIVARARGLGASVLAFSTLLVCNGLQVLSLVVRPFSARGFRRVNRWIANTWWGACVLWARKCNGTRVVVTGDDLPDRENAIVVSNHQEMSDIPVLMDLALSKRRLGDMKWFVKNPVKYVPGVGWGMLFLDCLFVKRNWTRDRSSILATFDRLRRHATPHWVISFVEGTRARPTKLEASRAFALSRGMQPTRHVLIPRTKGFVATTEGLRGHAQAVYDMTIGYVDGVPSLWQWVQGRVRTVHVHVRRFAAEDLPVDGEALSEWLLERFRVKDELLERFCRDGAFVAREGAA